MTAMIQGDQVRSNTLGIAVFRAAALQPATTTAAIFTIAGGKVLITSIVGEVVVATPATVNTLAINGTPTSGTQVVWASAVSTASKEAGTVITIAGTVGGALVVNNAGAGNPITPTGLVGQIGTITLTTTGTAATGTIKWMVTYVPLDNGASVTAA